jgi:excisionase family DNA binding protein
MNDLSVAEAADRLRVSRRTVYRLLESGALDATRVGKLWRIPVTAVLGPDGGWQAERRPEVEEAAATAIDVVLERAAREQFSRYFTEADVVADLASELRSRVLPSVAEIHQCLDTAGSPRNCFPDLSVIQPLEGLTDRRGSVAYHSMEIKYFGRDGDVGPYRLGVKSFDAVVGLMETQFDQLVERIRSGLLGSAALVWIDPFDWRRQVALPEQRQVIRDRAEWVRSRFASPDSRVRLDYLPLLHEEHRVTLLNGLPAPEQPVRKRGLLRGAAVPHIRRRPSPEDDWDAMVSESAAEDWRRKHQD